MRKFLNHFSSYEKRVNRGFRYVPRSTTQLQPRADAAAALQKRAGGRRASTRSCLPEKPETHLDGAIEAVRLLGTSRNANAASARWSRLVH